MREKSRIFLLEVNNMTEQEYNNKLNKIKEQNLVKKQKESLRKAKYKVEGMETSKKLAIYLFIILNIIIAYSLVAMWHFSDLNYLGALITDIGAQIVLYGIYCLKAYHGKKQEELMSFEREKYENEFLANEEVEE